MSLINKMLQDLESRKNPQPEAISKKSVYEDLKPLNRVPSSRAPSRRLMMLLTSVVVVGVGAYAWMQWGEGLVARLFPGQVVTKSPPVMARKAAPPKSAPVPAPSPAPVTTVVQTTDVKSPPAPQGVATDKAVNAPMNLAQVQVVPPVTIEQKKPEVASTSAAANKVAPAKSKAAVANESGYWTVSRGETLYGISAQTGIDLWDMSSWNKLGRDQVIHPGQKLRLTPPTKAETMQAISIKASAPKMEQTVVASAAASGTQKPEPKAASPIASSVKDSQTSKAIMDKKMKPLSSNEKAESEYLRAVDMLQKGRMPDAEKYLKLALKADESHAQARELLAGVMLQQGHWREAQQLLEQGIDMVPAHYPFAQLLARVYVEHGADQKALAVMEASQRAGAESPEYLAFLAALYQRAGKHAEAVKTYSEAVTLNPQEGRWWLGMGISLEAVQDWNTAGNAYQRAIESGVLEEKLLTYARQRLAAIRK